MKTFWKLLKESVIVQAAITLMLVSTVCYLWVAQITIPEGLAYSLMLVLGYYFGSKTQNILNKGG